MKKCNFGFFALLLIATISFSSCNKTQLTTIDPNSIVSYAAGDSITETLRFTKAVPFEKTYKGCDGNEKKSKRNAAVDTAIEIHYVGQGERNNMAAIFAANGWTIIANGGGNSSNGKVISPVDPTNGNTGKITPMPVVQPEAETPSNPIDWSWFLQLLAVLAAIAVIALACYLLYLLVHGIRRHSASLNKDYSNNNNNGGGNQNLKDNNLNLPARGTGSASFKAPIAGVKKTVIERKETVTHYYTDGN